MIPRMISTRELESVLMLLTGTVIFKLARRLCFAQAFTQLFFLQTDTSATLGLAGEHPYEVAEVTLACIQAVTGEVVP
jgi:hypothetical protein